MQTIALVTQKGGSGKTTLATNLAVAAAADGEVVAALDLDPQASLTAWGQARQDSAAPLVLQIPQEKASALPDLLASLAERGHTLAILDCPGMVSTIANMAMEAADLNIVPMRPTKLDTKAAAPTFQTLIQLNRPFVFALNQCPPNVSRPRDTAEAFGHIRDVVQPFITARADFQDAFAAGKGVTEFAPTSKAADEARQLWQSIKHHLNREAKTDVKTALNR